MSSYEPPKITPVANARELFASSGRTRPNGQPIRTTHKCGACGANVFSARWRDSGELVHVERGARGGDLDVVAELPGLAVDALPHVIRVGHATEFKQHACRPKTFSSASWRRKQR